MGLHRVWTAGSGPNKKGSLVVTIPYKIGETMDIQDGDYLYIEWMDIIKKTEEALQSTTYKEANEKEAHKS